MNISALYIVLIPLIEAGLTARGLTATVKRNQQPRQQGTPSTPTIFMSHIGTRPYGFPCRADVWDSVGHAMNHTETQFQWSRFQISGLAPQTPADPTLPTTADYVRAAALTMQSDAFRAGLFAQNVGILRITDVSSIYFVDDKGQNEENPTFDVILTHMDVLTVAGSFITNTEAVIQGI